MFTTNCEGKSELIVKPSKQNFDQALRQEQCDVVDTMLADGYIPDPTCINIVCKNGNLTLLQTLLKYDMDLQAGLLTTVRNQDIDKNQSILNYLFAAGVDVNCTNKYGVTPLHCVEDEDTCRWLLDMGARQVPDFYGNMPLHQTCVVGNINVVKLLLTFPEGVQSISSSGDYQQTPLYQACFYGYTEIVKLLLSYPEGVQTIGLANENGDTPLYSACSYGNVDTVKLLLSYPEGVQSIGLANKNGETPLYRTCKRSLTDIAKLLLSFPEGVQTIDVSNENGETPLYGACCNGYADVVKLLLSFPEGVQTIDVSNENGETPLYGACCNGRVNVVKLLLSFPEGVQTIDVSNENDSFPIDTTENCPKIWTMLQNALKTIDKH